MAQAVWKVCSTRSKEEACKFKEKLRVYAISDQYDGTGPWLKQQHPDIFYITANKTFRGMYREGDPELVGEEWVRQNIREAHGALGSAYPMYDGGDPWGKVSGVKEGDTPSFLYLIPCGLGNPERPSWGSWGGRFDGDDKQYHDAADWFNGEQSILATVAKWRPAYQADFAARMDWCTKTYEEANHAPVVIVEGDTKIIAAAGEELKLGASASYDPDGSRIFFTWEVYQEAGSYQGGLKIKGIHEAEAVITLPLIDARCTIHIILTVTDDGTPPLTRYQRFTITVVPENK